MSCKGGSGEGNDTKLSRPWHPNTHLQRIITANGLRPRGSSK